MEDYRYSVQQKGNCTVLRSGGTGQNHSWKIQLLGAEHVIMGFGKRHIYLYQRTPAPLLILLTNILHMVSYLMCSVIVSNKPR